MHVHGPGAGLAARECVARELVWGKRHRVMDVAPVRSVQRHLEEHRPNLPGALDAACVGLVAAEALGSMLMWLPIPVAWMWIGARVYDVTNSLAADMGVAFCGFLACTILTMRGLARIDLAWIAVRRRAGHDQRQGALTYVVVVSATLGIIGFYVWYYVLSNAFVLPFMPSQ
jgi:hypothetical protein